MKRIAKALLYKRPAQGACFLCNKKISSTATENLPLRKREYGKAGREIRNNKNYLLRHYVTPPLKKRRYFK